MYNIVLFFLVCLLSSCFEKPNHSTPAQEQINQYTDKLKKCADDSTSEAASDSPKEENTKNNLSYTTEIGWTPNAKDIVLGNRESNLVLIEYFSPTCPHCAYYHKKVFPTIHKKYIETNKIAYVIREFIGNKQDLDASLLARCTDNQDDFLKFTEITLEQQSNWAFNENYRTLLNNLGQLGGIAAERYQECLNDNQLTEFLIKNTRFVAKQPGFIGTPSFFINGERFAKAYSIDFLSYAIDEALKK